MTYTADAKPENWVTSRFSQSEGFHGNIQKSAKALINVTGSVLYNRAEEEEKCGLCCDGSRFD